VKLTSLYSALDKCDWLLSAYETRRLRVCPLDMLLGARSAPSARTRK
jgi:hypothetical protein